MMFRKLKLASTFTPAALAAVAALGMSASAQAQTVNAKQGIDVPNNVNIYALTSDNVIYALRPNSGVYTRLGRVSAPNGGNLVGIDFRPADNNPNQLYGISDLGDVFTINLNSNPFGAVTTLSRMNPTFNGGILNVMDFNPVANALRVTGSNDQNIAVTGANLASTVQQTTLAYAQGDVNQGKNPEITGGAYTNNFVGATSTIFYMIDHAQDTLVTIAQKTATGSNTGGGQLQTIGRLVDVNGQPLNMSSTTDFDIYTDSNGRNFLVGQVTRLLFSIDLGQVNPNLQVGRTQNIVVKRGPAAANPASNAPLTGGVFDIAIPPRQ